LEFFYGRSSEFLWKKSRIFLEKVWNFFGKSPELIKGFIKIFKEKAKNFLVKIEPEIPLKQINYRFYQTIAGEKQGKSFKS